MDKEFLDQIVPYLSPRISRVDARGGELLFSGEDIAYRLSSSAEEDSILQRLHQSGYLLPEPLEVPKSEAAFEEYLGAPAKARIEIRCCGSVRQEPAQELLERCGIDVDEPADWRLILSDDYLNPDLEDCLSDSVPNLVAKIIGIELWFGPLLRIEAKSKWRQAQYWLRAHRAESARGSNWTYPPQVSVAANTASTHLACSWLANALSALSAGGRLTEFESGIVSLDLRTMRMTHHPLHLELAEKFLPREWISPKTGIVSRVLREVEAFGQCQSLLEYALPPLFEDLHRQRTRGFAYGSGCRQEEAREKAIYEAVERYSLSFDGEEDLIVQAYDPDVCLHPADLLQSLEQASNDPNRFREDLPIAWMRGKALGNYPDKLIPAAVVLMDYNDESQANFAISTSSGCAAGPDWETAVRSAWHELIERDAVALWWYRQALRPAWDWRPSNCERTERIAAAILKAGRSFEILDLSTEFGIHVCVAVSADGNGGDPVFGAGSGASMRCAARSATRELSQVLTWRREWQDKSPYGCSHMMNFLKTWPGEAANLDRLSAPPAYAVNLTRQRVGLSVARVLSPGLQPLSFSLEGRRLWEAPERLQWHCQVNSPDEFQIGACPL